LRDDRRHFIGFAGEKSGNIAKAKPIFFKIFMVFEFRLIKFCCWVLLYFLLLLLKNQQLTKIELIEDDLMFRLT
jgi:hypothetical protein